MALKITKREENIFQIISKVGAITRKMLVEEFGMDRRRITKLEKEGFFKKHTDTEKEGKRLKNKYVYSFGTTGKAYAKEKGYCIVTEGYNGYKHNLKAEKAVKELLFEKNIPIDKILNEKEQELIFKNEIRNARRNKVNFRVNDIAYWDNQGNLHSLEIENNYRKSLIEQHSNYATQVLNVEYEYIK